MIDVEQFLDAYGLPAIFGVMLLKAAGLPIPVPSDLIILAAGARAAEGKLALWQVATAILLALVFGGFAQFVLARSLGLAVLVRFGRYVGLTNARIDAAARGITRVGALGIGLAIMTPGVRAATVAACGVTGVAIRTFATGLLLGSASFVALHFTLGYVGWALAAAFVASLSPAVAVGALLLVVLPGLGVWYAVRWRRRRTPGEVMVEAWGAWMEAT